MSMNFNAYDSRTIVIHKKIIMKLTLMYIWQAFVSFSASDIVSWPSISFVLRHKYDASAREDVVVVFFATSSFLVIAYMMQCIQLGHSSTSTTCMKSTKCLNKLMVGGGDDFQTFRGNWQNPFSGLGHCIQWAMDITECVHDLSFIQTCQ